MMSATLNYWGTRRAYFIAVLMLSLLAACSTNQTPYLPPSVQIPPQFTNASSMDVVREDTWWMKFGDVQLNQLIDEVLHRNNDLAAATIKVRRAQLTAGIAADSQTPQWNANVNASYSKNLNSNPIFSRSNSTQLSVSYELDLWRRLSSLTDAAQWEARASEEDRESTALSLIGTTATLYWTAIYLNERLDLAAQSIVYAEQTLQLVRVQYDAGAVSLLELMEAQKNVAIQRAGRTLLLQQQVENNNALTILFDGPPRPLSNLPKHLPDNEIPALAAGIPAEVLARRPDLRAAEYRLRESLANVDAVRSSFYPTFTLTGGVGTSNTATLGLGVVLPFVQWTQGQLKIKVSQADYEYAVINFRQALYNALSEVEGALSARKQYADQAVLLRQSLVASKEVERLYEIRYRTGSVALSVFLDAQDKRRLAEIAIAENRLNTLNNQMTLYRVLGGGDTPKATKL